MIVFVGYHIERRIKLYWLTMNLAMRFGIPNGMFFSLFIQRIDVVKEQGAMVGPHSSFMATFGWIVIGQNGSNSL
jgi:hypothetical protein